MGDRTAGGRVTGREAEVLSAIFQNLTNAEIATGLFLSERTVESHVSSLLRKFGATNRRDLVRVAGRVAGASVAGASPYISSRGVTVWGGTMGSWLDSRRTVRSVRSSSSHGQWSLFVGVDVDRSAEEATFGADPRSWNRSPWSGWDWLGNMPAGRHVAELSGSTRSQGVVDLAAVVMMHSAESFATGVRRLVVDAAGPGGSSRATAIERVCHLLDAGSVGACVATDRGLEMLVEVLDPELPLFDFGAHRLADLGRAERLFQLGGDAPRAPLRTLDSYRHNLPVQLTSLVGRSDDVERVLQRLTDARLVTLSGAGGVGKTRLALAVAGRAVRLFPGGVWWVPLGDTADASSVNEVLATMAGLSGVSPVLRDVAARLGSSPSLIVLDNCEHLVAECAAKVEELLTSNAAISVLATSREPLAVPGEVVAEVAPLAVPVSTADPDATWSSPAAQLFSDRLVREGQSDIDAGVHGREIARICRRLDGIPLALELAAARAALVGVRSVAAELEDRFDLLASDRRRVPDRHQTLMASIEWSHARLSDGERRVFRQLAVFVGPFSPDIAIAVAATTSDHRALDAPAMVGRLVRCGLVSTVGSLEGVVSLRLLDSVRFFAAQQLEDAGDAERVRDAHVHCWLTLVAADGEGPTDAQVAMADTYGDDLRAAIGWAAERDPELGLKLLSAAAQAWHGTGRGFDAVWAADAVLTEVNARRSPTSWLQAAAMTLHHHAFIRGGAGVRDLASRARTAAVEVDGAYPQAIAAWLERSDEVRSAHLAELAAMHGDFYLMALARLAQAEDLAERDPIAASNMLASLAATARPTNHYIDSIVALVAGRISRDTGDLARCVELGERLAHSPSGQMAFNGMILLVQAGLLSRSSEPLELARRAAGVPRATPRMLTEATVATTYASYLDGHRPTRIDPELVSEPMSAGSLWICCREAIEAGHIEEARRAVDVLANADGLRRAVYTAITAAAGDPAAWYQTIELARDFQLRPIITDALEALAVQHATQRHWRHCLRLVSSAQRLREETGYQWRFPTQQHEIDNAVVASTAGLGHEQAGRSTEQGLALGWHAACAYALRNRGARKRPTFGWESLTPTERDVAKLVAHGLRNDDVARRLLMSVTTVRTHLRHIFVKLSVNNRAELASTYTREIGMNPSR